MVRSTVGLWDRVAKTLARSWRSSWLACSVGAVYKIWYLQT